ncbi:hypothetical protein [Microbacterium sp. SD291]|uniref:hypothetical protein n=1 Tax=Microbacterium sp. SD291 TaxID=2782007 RepID=UPI001A9795AF|nr:hypothetical protein [Microbacterium sp. SD291]MBO0980196.1 hypothetical protein [Microbacterium sp. SD291]
MVNDLASILVPIGVTGAALAALCAIVAAVAIVRGAGGLVGGAVGVWIPFAVLSSTAGFASQWTPLLASAIVLVAMLAVGGIVRAIMHAATAGRMARPVHTADAVRVAVPAAPPVPAGPPRAGVGAALTGTVATLARQNPARAA